MGRLTRFFAFAAVGIVATSCSIGSAFAQGTSTSGGSADGAGVNATELTARYVDRPLVDPAMSLRVFSGPNDPRTWTLDQYRGINDYGIGFERYSLNVDEVDFGPFSAAFKTSTVAATFRIGAAFTPIDNLEVGIGFPFAGGGRGIDDIPVWVTYQFLKTEAVEIGARFAMFLPAQTNFGMQLGLPVALHLGEMLRVDTGLFVNMVFLGKDSFGDSSAVYGRMFIPARFSVQITDEIFAGGMLGVDIRDFDSFAMMFGFHGGYTLALDAAIIDFGLSWTWPGLIHIQPEDGSRIGGILTDPSKAGDGNDFDIQFGANMAIQF